MSVQSEITRIQNAVNSAIAAIEDKGVSVSEDAGVADLAGLIASLTGEEVATGTYTSADDGNQTINIVHNLGRKPLYAAIFSHKVTSNTYIKRGEVVISIMGDGNSNNLLFTGSSSDNYATYYVTGSDIVTISETTVTFNSNVKHSVARYSDACFDPDLTFFYVIWG